MTCLENIWNIIDKAGEDCISGKGIKKDTMITLLNLDPSSKEAAYLRKTANRAAHVITDNSAYLWGAIGIDFVPCSMNCKFCSFGEKWGIIKDEVIYSEEEIIEQVKDYADSGIRFIVLRTTEFYNIDDLCRKIKKIKHAIKGGYELILNVGEFDSKTACKIHEAGVSGIYHAIRLREGTDTPFDPDVRENTMKAVKDSPLKLISLVEPVGNEHTADELANNFIRIMNHDACISGAMARIPVAGTPLGDTSMITEERIAQLTAVFRLAASKKIPDICVHPCSEMTAMAGANVAVIEKGAIPRDDKFMNNEWKSLTADRAKKMFDSSGYEVLTTA